MHRGRHCDRAHHHGDCYQHGRDLYRRSGYYHIGLGVCLRFLSVVLWHEMVI